ncbi:Zinc finger protein 512B [Anthophora plagiata]
MNSDARNNHDSQALKGASPEEAHDRAIPSDRNAAESGVLLICVMLISAAFAAEEKTVQKRGLLNLGIGHGGWNDGLLGAELGHGKLAVAVHDRPVAVPVPVLKPYPVAVDRPVPVKVPVAVPHPVPVAVPVPKPYPVIQTQTITVPVEKPYPVTVPVKVAVPVPAPYPVHVPVSHPVPVLVSKPVAVPVPQTVLVKEQVPVLVKGHGYGHY